MGRGQPVTALKMKKIKGICNGIESDIGIGKVIGISNWFFQTGCYLLSYRYGLGGYRYRIDMGWAIIGTLSFPKKQVDTGPWCSTSGAHMIIHVLQAAMQSYYCNASCNET